MKNLPPTPMLDALQRPIHDLRISVTDRCNFRCVYCMPRHIFGPDYPFLKRSQLLTYEEIERVARIFVLLGVRKLRLTGGEPLVRNNIETLIGQLAAIEGVQDLSLTTNGSLLTRKKADKLYAAGLRRITVSLDSLDGETFRSINGVDFAPEPILEAINTAADAGLSPVKVNMVVKRGVNDNAVLSAARYFKGSGHILRFIEYMDVGNSNAWQKDEVISAGEIRDIIGREHPIEPVSPDYHGEVAQKWRFTDGEGEIGIIASVSQPFCGSCTRARLSADGSLYTCLFATEGHDLRSVLRGCISDEDLKDRVRSIWSDRSDRYSELRATQVVEIAKVEMSYIGG
jgi:cyclic pyranopterin phosphate synthase